MTYSVAMLEISPAAYDEIHEKLVKANYEHTFMNRPAKYPTIDMAGIGLVRGPKPKQVMAENDARTITRNAKAL